MKRIASIQDISCLGRCSLTVALPVISAMAVECAIVPPAGSRRSVPMTFRQKARV